MKRLISSLMIAAALIGLTTAFAGPSVLAVDSINPSNKVQEGVKASGGGDGDGGSGLKNAIKTVINVLLFVIGAVAVIMIVIGGLRYTISNGDSSQITGAKNTILYAVIGLVVAMLAYAIVNFVVDAF